ncbi:hypothetical protein [Pontibacter virosus]|uniref:Uncharacterized protein n=1 Tax=Pontibacter virosus TaxID=1765052 RepID=A0A2U1AGX9_9BACT|nr:hypothetical protein [Pontibacter virosus]PVY35662.1 hypothetical protein C8E01_1324 [Pontibacter virosus]
MILINEILYADGEEIVLKTIDINKKLYGMHSTLRGRIIAPTFYHIFKFKEGATSAVAVTKDEEFIAIDFNGMTSDLASEQETFYRNLIIKNSRCNCYNFERSLIGCIYCNGMRQIPNPYSMKLLDQVWKD